MKLRERIQMQKCIFCSLGEGGYPGLKLISVLGFSLASDLL